MKLEYKYIKFVNIPFKGKTTHWEIQNIRTGATLGWIKWYSAWRQYCFFTKEECVFNSSCMKDILDFIAQLMADREEKDILAFIDQLSADQKEKDSLEFFEQLSATRKDARNDKSRGTRRSRGDGI